MDREPIRYLDSSTGDQAAPGSASELQALGTFLDDLPSGDPPAGDPAGAATSQVDPAKFVPIEQFNALAADLAKFKALGPIAEELARDPARAEDLRRQIINGPPAAPVSTPGLVQPAAPVSLTDEQKQRVIAAFFDNPVGLIDQVARIRADAIVSERIGGVNSTTSAHALRLFHGAKAAEDTEEYNATRPYFDQALQGVDLAQLSGSALDNFLAISWDASAAKAYRAAAKGAGAPVAAPDPPPYGGSGGAPARGATAPIQRAAGAPPAPAGGEVRTLVASLAGRSGLTQADFKKYGAVIEDQLGA